MSREIKERIEDEKQIDNKKQINDLISESNVMLESLREFFYSVRIHCDPILNEGGCSISDLPKMWEYDPDMKFDPLEDPAFHYRWFKLTNDQFLVQDELFRKYINWASSARDLVEKFSPEKLDIFDEEAKTVRNWIEMSKRLPSDDNAEMFLQFKKHFTDQQNIVYALLEQIE